MDPVGFDVLLTEFSNALKKVSSQKLQNSIRLHLTPMTTTIQKEKLSKKH